MDLILAIKKGGVEDARLKGFFLNIWSIMSLPLLACSHPYYGD